MKSSLQSMNLLENSKKESQTQNPSWIQFMQIFNPQKNFIFKSTKDISIQKQIAVIFINISAVAQMCFLYETQFIETSVSVALESKDTQLKFDFARILSNLARSEEGVIFLFSELNSTKLSSIIGQFVEQFLFDENATPIGFALRNFSQSKDVRKELIRTTEGQSSHFLKLIKFISSNANEERRLIATDIIRNVTFDTDQHSEIVGIENLISDLLWPLCGPEEFTEEENEKLPIDLQYLEPEKQREKDERIRLSLIESVYELCATSMGRNYLRDNGAYFLLREYQKWEKIPEIETVCLNVISLLIRYEHEIGAEDLKKRNPDEVS